MKMKKIFALLGLSIVGISSAFAASNDCVTKITNNTGVVIFKDIQYADTSCVKEDGNTLTACPSKLEPGQTVYLKPNTEMLSATFTPQAYQDIIDQNTHQPVERSIGGFQIYVYDTHKTKGGSQCVNKGITTYYCADVDGASKATCKFTWDQSSGDVDKVAL